MPHRLSDKNLDALTATCSVCGAGARIRKNGESGYVCVVANRQARSRYRQAHPERTASDRKFKPSKHRLQNRKGGSDTCVICGPVQSVAIGWGYMCPTRAAELNWKNLPEAPVPLCSKCLSRHLDKMGACPECDGPMPAYDTRRPGKYIDAEVSTSAWSDFETEAMDLGLTIRDEPMDILDDSPAVPGWKTLGSNRPSTEHTVRPEYAALYGGKR